MYSNLYNFKEKRRLRNNYVRKCTDKRYGIFKKDVVHCVCDEEVISSEQNYKKFLLYLDKKSIANFRFKKYNDILVQLRISNKEFQKRKKESAFIMRKQTKLVAVLSASALLALGASMTSYAAGWTEENGTWVYYDNDGYQVTDEWKRSGNYWFW